MGQNIQRKGGDCSSDEETAGASKRGVIVFTSWSIGFLEEKIKLMKFLWKEV